MKSCVKRLIRSNFFRKPLFFVFFYLNIYLYTFSVITIVFLRLLLLLFWEQYKCAFKCNGNRSLLICSGIWECKRKAIPFRISAWNDLNRDEIFGRFFFKYVFTHFKNTFIILFSPK